ncbi:MAG: rhomboid family intramembrane serine protease [Acidobacteriota bacterium]
MFLIPVGHDQYTMRRRPVVCFVIMGLNALTFLMCLGHNEEQWVSQLDRRAAQVESFLAGHPYLRVPQDLQPLPAPFLKELEQIRMEAEQTAEAPRGAALGSEQAKLDQLASDLLETYYEDPGQRLGFNPRAPSALTVVTHLFLHADIFHLLGNMLFLWVVGRLLEDVYGRILFPLLYFLSGVSAALLHMVKSGADSGTLIGASGAIAGLMGAFLVRCYNRRIRFLFVTILFIKFIRAGFSVPAYLVLPFWFLSQALLMNLDGDSSGIAYAAHVAGFMIGAAAAMLIKALGIEERFIDPAIERKVAPDRPSAVDRAAELRLDGNLTLARRRIEELLRRAPGDLHALGELYQIELASRQKAAAGKIAVRLLSAYIENGENELAETLVKSVSREIRNEIPAEFFALAKRRMVAAGSPEEARAAEPTPPSDMSATSEDIMQLYRDAERLRADGRFDQARDLYGRALAHPACNDSWREAIDRALNEMGHGRTPGLY